ncbi:MAG: ribonuclease Y [Microgenomates group bacterium]
MGILDALVKALVKEELKKEGKGKTPLVGKKPKGEVELAREVAAKIAELERREGALEERERLLDKKAKELEEKLAEVEEIKKSEVARLEKIAGLTTEEAKKLILEGIEKKLAEDIARKIKEAEEEIKTRAEEKAKEILIEAMQHGVTDYVAEYTVSTVHLPDEDIKGRIIGREGRNIRTFERATGVEIELDESNEITLSSFDSIRREIARRSLEKLIRDRRITPARIEETVQRTRQEVEKIMFEEGEKLCHSVGVYRLHPDLVKLLGRFKFRFSYGQNMIVHTLEETKIGVQIAWEVGANVNVVRLGCLLHDIGKVVSEQEGTHVQIGVDLARKYRLPEEVIACIAEHHEDKPFSSAESRIVWIADAASGSRPGARYEAHEEYVQRISQIEEIAKSFEGVQEAFAYQAGRDVRVLVKPEEISDDQLVVLAQKITSALEEKVSWAGQIKVTCIRETRATEFTKAK